MAEKIPVVSCSNVDDRRPVVARLPPPPRILSHSKEAFSCVSCAKSSYSTAKVLLREMYGPWGLEPSLQMPILFRAPSSEGFAANPATRRGASSRQGHCGLAVGLAWFAAPFGAEEEIGEPSCVGVFLPCSGYSCFNIHCLKMSDGSIARLPLRVTYTKSLIMTLRLHCQSRSCRLWLQDSQLVPRLLPFGGNVSKP